MCAKRHVEGMFGRIADEAGLIGLHKEKELIAVHEPSTESLVHARLVGQAAIVIHGGVERIVRSGDVVGQNRGRKFGFCPGMRLEGVG